MRDGLSNSPGRPIEPGPPASTRMDALAGWLAGQPLVPPAVGLVIGITLDAAWHVPVILAISVFVAAGAMIGLSRRAVMLCHAGLLLAALATGAVLHDLSFRRWPADHIVRYCGHEPTGVRLTATVISTPAISPPQSGRIEWFRQSPRTRLLVAAERIEGTTGDIQVSGLVTVHVREPVLHVSAGDRVELFGRMYRPLPPMNPGARDWALAGRRDGILVEMSCEHAANVVVLAVGDRGHRWMAAMRRRLRAAMLEDTFPGDVPGSQLLAAMVLGQRSAVSPEVNQAFVNTGTVHYLSVSGAHVGMLASVVWLVGLLTGASRRKCAAVALVIVTAYALAAEPQPPIVRAMIMANLLCLAVLGRRPARSANWLAAAAIVLLVIGPTQLFNAGFQLSFATMLAVMFVGPRLRSAGVDTWRRVRGRDDPLLSPAIQRRINPPSRTRRVCDWLLNVLGWWLAISVGAWLVGTLISVYHFRQLALWGWLDSILILPLVWLALVLGFGKTLLAMVVPDLAGLLGKPLAMVTDALLWLVNCLAQWPGAGLPAPAISAWLTCAGLAVLGFWVVRPWLRVSIRWVTAAAGILAALTVWQVMPTGATGTLRLDVLSVGDGAACVIGLPNGRTVLCDIGTRPPRDLQKWVVGPLLAERRIYSIAAVVLSHPNLDHYDGLPDLLDHHRVKAVIAAPHFEHFARESQSAHRLMADVAAHDIPWHTVVQGDGLDNTGDATLELLWPPPLDQASIPEPNESSIVLRITYAGRRVLLCGDIQAFAEARLLAEADLRADVLLLPHHGGVTKTTRAFIAAVNPTYCIRSTGQRDSLTRNGLLGILAGRTYFNTADDGAVQVRIGPAELSVEPYARRD